MDATMTETSERPAPYSLSVADFQTPFPNSPTLYKQGERVTRENFTSFIIAGFSVSRGQPPAHDAYFRWMETNHGLNYRELIRNFVSAGGVDILSQAEKEMILNAARRVERHKNVPSKYKHLPPEDLRTYSDDNLLLAVDDQINSLMRTVYTGRPPVPESELKGMSFASLQSRINEWIKTLPRRREAMVYVTNL